MQDFSLSPEFDSVIERTKIGSPLLCGRIDRIFSNIFVLPDLVDNVWNSRVGIGRLRRAVGEDVDSIVGSKSKNVIIITASAVNNKSRDQ